MKLRKKLCALLSDALDRAQQKNHRLAEKNRLKAAISRAEHSRDLAYTSLGKHYYETGKADAASKPYFDRIKRSSDRIKKASGQLRAYGEAARKKEKQPQLPPALRLELETEAIVSQIERETDAILLPQASREPLQPETQELLRAVSAPEDRRQEECALENDSNVPWE